MRVDTERLTVLGRELLVALGENPDRDGLRDTPARWARWWHEFLTYDAGRVDTAFASVRTDQLVVLREVAVWSLCEHHLLPFSCTLTLGYLAESRVLGISKLVRLARRHAHALQVQERLVEGIARELQELVATRDVAVVGRGVHLCMAMRGVRAPAEMVTSALYGAFRDQTATRAEFFALAREAR
jgi:GTP cyclohydrolase I